MIHFFNVSTNSLMDFAKAHETLVILENVPLQRNTGTTAWWQIFNHEASPTCLLQHLEVLWQHFGHNLPVDATELIYRNDSSV